jgi:hypothetical protein
MTAVEVSGGITSCCCGEPSLLILGLKLKVIPSGFTVIVSIIGRGVMTGGFEGLEAMTVTFSDAIDFFP